jgi:hypothetical protein
MKRQQEVRRRDLVSSRRRLCSHSLRFDARVCLFRLFVENREFLVYLGVERGFGAIWGISPCRSECRMRCSTKRKNAMMKNEKRPHEQQQQQQLLTTTTTQQQHQTTQNSTK